jgi:hypothetical protein
MSTLIKGIPDGYPSCPHGIWFAIRKWEQLRVDESSGSYATFPSETDKRMRGIA